MAIECVLGIMFPAIKTIRVGVSEAIQSYDYYCVGQFLTLLGSGNCKLGS